MPESYSLKLMGFPELCGPDGRPVKLKVRKHLALLIYLVLDARELHFRTELADLLWPGVPEVNSRHSLSMAFSVLRGLFGSNSITGNHAEIRFRSPGIALDLDRLEAGKILGNEVVPQLEIDGFLRGFQIDDAPGFQHWRDRRSAQLQPALQAGLLLLVDQARRTADLPGMLRAADRLLALDPLAEEGVRARMEALAMQGDRVSALRVFEEWKRELAQELGARPSDILQGIAARLRRGVEAPAPAIQLDPGTGPFTAPRLIGRAAEYGVLFEAWERTTQLNTRHVLVTGEAGIGKSTLAMRFGAAVGLEGAAVSRVQCFELEQRMAFGMIGALITGMLEVPAVAGTVPESLAEVARVVPKVRERFPGLPAPRPSEGEAARLHFAEGVIALLEAILEQQPVVLIVDDYPRSDEASLSVLHMILRRMMEERLMVVLTGRPPEAGESPQAMRIRQAFGYLPFERIEVGPLPNDDCDRLLTAVLNGGHKHPGLPERRAILRTAGGNPMALELLTQDWLRHGDAALAVLLPAMGEVPTSALEALAYDRLIERILPALTPRTRISLYMAAVLGPRINELEIFEALELKPAQVMLALTELVGHRVLRSRTSGLEFVNELVRARVYLKIPTASRVRIHQVVADHLVRLRNQGGLVADLEIAWHCIRSGRREQATTFLLTGARRAMLQGAPHDAARALSTAIGQLKDKAKIEATLLLAETYQEMDEWQEALDCIRDLQLSSIDGQAGEEADMLEVRSRIQLSSYALTDKPGLLRELLLKTSIYRGSRSRALAALSAATLVAQLREQELLGLVDEALTNLDGLEARDECVVLTARAMTSYHKRDEEQCLSALRNALDLSRSIGALDSTFAQIHNGLGSVASAHGKYEEGIHHLGHAFEAAKRLDNSQLMTQSAANTSLCYYRIGKYSESLKWATIAWDKAQQSSQGLYTRIHSAARCALACAALADHSKARHWTKFLREGGAAARLEWERQAAVLFEADVLWLMGARESALELVKVALATSNSANYIGFTGPIARWITLSSIHGEEGEAAAALFLENHYNRLPSLDALDQAEILCCMLRLKTPMRLDSGSIAVQAKLALARLPIECARQINRLGISLPT